MSTKCCNAAVTIEIVQNIENNEHIGNGICIEPRCTTCKRSVGDLFVAHFPAGSGKPTVQPLAQIRSRKSPRQYLIDSVRSYADALKACRTKHGADVVEGLNAWHIVREFDRLQAGATTLEVSDKELERMEALMKRALQRIDMDLAVTAQRNALRMGAMA